MRNIFTDYVDAWLLWGKNQERHARMAEALLKDSTEHEKGRPVQRRTEALDRPPPPRNTSETAVGESNAELKQIPRRRLSQRATLLRGRVGRPGAIASSAPSSQQRIAPMPQTTPWSPAERSSMAHR